MLDNTMSNTLLNYFKKTDPNKSSPTVKSEATPNRHETLKNLDDDKENQLSKSANKNVPVKREIIKQEVKMSVDDDDDEDDVKPVRLSAVKKV